MCGAAFTSLLLAYNWKTVPTVRSGAVQSHPASHGTAGRRSSSTLFREYTVEKSKKSLYSTFLWLFFEHLCVECLKLTAHRAHVLFIPAQQGLWATAAKAQILLWGHHQHPSYCLFPKSCRMKSWYYSSQWEFHFCHWRGNWLWSKIWHSAQFWYYTVVIYLSTVWVAMDKW